MINPDSQDPNESSNPGMGRALPTWTYVSEELLELEYTPFFLESWQFVGHANELKQAGDFITLDLWRDSVMVLRGGDGALRAFLNICRHRASRLLDGRGNCGGTIRCPYHGWTYQNDGRLSGIPSPQSFPGVDRSKFGLLEIQCEVFRGLVFVRIAGHGASVRERLAELDGWIDAYRAEEYVLLREPVTEIWETNWKVAWDNYLENYHIPVGHPALHRMTVESDLGAELPGGGSAGFFEMNPKPSPVERERRYQELIGCTDHRYPETIRRKWLQIDFESNMGVEFYPALFSVFQLVPIAADKTVIKMSQYTPPDLSKDEEELRTIDLAILDEVNAEDKFLCERIQRGVRTHGYRPGPLSDEESGIHDFHERIRQYFPVTRRSTPPPRLELESVNRVLTDSTDGLKNEAQ